MLLNSGIRKAQLRTDAVSTKDSIMQWGGASSKLDFFRWYWKSFPNLTSWVFFRSISNEKSSHRRLETLLKTSCFSNIESQMEKPFRRLKHIVLLKLTHHHRDFQVENHNVLFLILSQKRYVYVWRCKQHFGRKFKSCKPSISRSFVLRYRNLKHCEKKYTSNVSCSTNHQVIRRNLICLKVEIQAFASRQFVFVNVIAENILVYLWYRSSATQYGSI